MITSGKGILRVCQIEAWVRVAYEDGVYRDGPLKGQPKYSYAFGSQTKLNGERVQLGDTVNLVDSVRLVAAIIYRNDVDLTRNLKVELPQFTFDAFTSLYYQSGSRVLKSVSAAFNTKSRKLAILEFAKYPTNERGEEKEGLADRRISEMHLARTGDYGDLSQFKAFDGDPKKVIPYYVDAPKEFLH